MHIGTVSVSGLIVSLLVALIAYVMARRGSEGALLVGRIFLGIAALDGIGMWGSLIRQVYGEDVGKSLVAVGLGASVAAIAAYIASLRGSRKALFAARALLGVTAVSVVLTFARLMWLVFHQQFQFKYVFEYSSPDLKFPWTIAATWAGQEGSFLLWAFWTGVIGCLVAWKAGKWEARVMPFYISVLTFLFAILAWLSPFNLLARGGATGYPLDLPWPPNFGQGLNPSLQNIWMAIHPPTIFFGFASLAVPFCFAVAAMVWKDYGGPEDPKGVNWASRVMPWVLLTVATLGVGLFMGGYWAYETLGWHGFWAWDPVENASLFPWLCALGLAHGLIVQKSRGGMGRTNIFLAIVAWVAFLWGTYLTRSGVLGDFSVHSFVSLASQPLDMLKWMLAIYGLGGMALLVFRWKKIPGRAISDDTLSRDTAMVVAVSLMIMAAVVIGVATSWPLISRLELTRHLPLVSKFASAKGMAAQASFYNKFGSAAIIPALLIMGCVPFLAWGKTNAEKFLTKVILPWMLAIAVGFGVVYFVITEMTSGVNPEVPGGIGFVPATPRMLVVAIATLGVFAAFSNILLATRILRTRSRVTLGGWLAHVGIGLLIVGTIIANVYEKTAPAVIVEGEKPVKTPFGYSLAFAGWSHDELEKQIDHSTDRDERARLIEELLKDWRHSDHAMKLRIVDTREPAGAAHADDGEDAPAGKSFTVEQKIFLNPMNPEGDPSKQRYYMWPYIHTDLFRDFYIAPANDPERARASATVREGQVQAIGYAYQGSPILMTPYMVRYKRFYMDGKPGTAGTVMRAELEVISHDGRSAIAKPGLKLGDASGPQSVTADIPSMQGTVRLAGGIDAATKSVTAEFEFPDAPTRWIVPIQVTNKPMVNLVWLGVAIMGLGTVIAMMRRSLEARKGAMIEAKEATGLPDTETPVVASVPPVPEPAAAGKGKRKASAVRT